MAKTPPRKPPPPDPTTPPSGDEPAAPVPPEGDQPAASGNGQGDPSAEDLAAVLRAVVLVGVDHVTPDTVGAMFGLRAVQERARDGTDERLTAAAREVIRAALDSLGDGNYGRAARLLYGAVDDTRGQPRRVRRRLAADQIDVLPKWFARRYEPQIASGVAAEILNIEHPPTGPSPSDNGGDGGAAVAVIGDDTPGTALEFVSDDDDRRPPTRGRLHRVITRARHPLAGDPSADNTPVVLASTPRTLAAVPARQLVSVLQGLQQQQARRTWHLLWIAGGVVVVVRYGRDALPRYVFVLAALGFLTTAVDTWRQWRATRSLALGERWPRLALYTAAVVLAAGFNIGQDHDPPTRPEFGCEWYERPCNDDDPSAPTTTEDPHPSPNYVPPTTAGPPIRAAAPDCPPAANPPERRLAFSGRPPLCINPGNRYTATIHTNYGHFTVTLNTQAAPWTVNNFVFLARWGFYDGVQLVPAPTAEATEPLPTEVWTHLFSGSPTNPHDPTTGTTTTTADPGAVGVPGYEHAFEAHQGAYPADDTLYLVMTDNGQPDQFAVVVTPEGHRQAEAGAALGLLGTVDPDCRGVIAQRDGTGGWDITPRSEAVVIDAITIAEEPATTPTTRPPVTDDPCGRLAAAQDDSNEEDQNP